MTTKYKHGWYSSPIPDHGLTLYSVWVHNELRFLSWFSPKESNAKYKEDLSTVVVEGKSAAFQKKDIGSLHKQVDQIWRDDAFTKVADVVRDMDGAPVKLASDIEPGWYRINHSGDGDTIWGLLEDGIWKTFVAVNDPLIGFYARERLLAQAAADLEAGIFTNQKFVKVIDRKSRHYLTGIYEGKNTTLSYVKRLDKHQERLQNAWYQLPAPYQTVYALHYMGKWSHFINTGRSEPGDSLTSKYTPAYLETIKSEDIRKYADKPEDLGVTSFGSYKAEDFKVWTDVSGVITKGDGVAKDGWYSLANCPAIQLLKLDGEWAFAVKTSVPAYKTKTNFGSDDRLSIDDVRKLADLDNPRNLMWEGGPTHNKKGWYLNSAKVPPTHGKPNGWYKVLATAGRSSNSDLFGALLNGKWVGWVYGDTAATSNLGSAPLWDITGAPSEFQKADQWEVLDFEFVREITHDYSGKSIQPPVPPKPAVPNPDWADMVIVFGKTESRTKSIADLLGNTKSALPSLEKIEAPAADSTHKDKEPGPSTEPTASTESDTGISMWLAAPLGLLAVAALSAKKKSKIKRKVVKEVVNAEHGIS